MENTYDTLVQAIEGLKEYGYVEDFNLKNSVLFCSTKNIELGIDDFVIDKLYRFDGATNPADESVLYAISSEKFNLKGTLVDAYGTYSDSLTQEMIQKLRFTP